MHASEGTHASEALGLPVPDACVPSVSLVRLSRLAVSSIRNLLARNCAVTAGPQTNWGSCLGTYAFSSLAVDGDYRP